MWFEVIWTFTLVSVREYRVPSKTTFTWYVLHPFCRWSFLAFSLPVYHPGGANWWPIPYIIDLWCPPHHGKIGFLHLLKCSDKKENTLVKSSPCNAKRQSLPWTLSIPIHCQVTTHSLTGHLLQKQLPWSSNRLGGVGGALKPLQFSSRTCREWCAAM